jgi:FkbM family methyltransferase
MQTVQPSFRNRIAGWIARSYPFLSGCGTFANSRWLKALSGKSATGLVWTRLSGESNEIVVPIEDYVGRAAYFVGDLDRKISSLLRRIIRPGDHVLDVGANLGMVSLRMSNLVGNMGKVDAFEPNPSMAELLQASIEKNQSTNVNLHRIAIGSTQAELDLMIPDENAGRASLALEATEGMRRIKVPVMTLDQLSSEHDFSRIRLMKVDVEGFEPQVFAGAKNWLKTTPPDAILFEHNNRQANLEDDPVIQQLNDANYDVFEIPRSMFRLQLVRMGQDHVNTTNHDFLAVHRTMIEDVLADISVR